MPTKCSRPLIHVEIISTHRLNADIRRSISRQLRANLSASLEWRLNRPITTSSVYSAVFVLFMWITFESRWGTLLSPLPLSPSAISTNLSMKILISHCHHHSCLSPPLCVRSRGLNRETSEISSTTSLTMKFLSPQLSPDSRWLHGLIWKIQNEISSSDFFTNGTRGIILREEYSTIQIIPRSDFTSSSGMNMPRMHWRVRPRTGWTVLPSMAETATDRLDIAENSLSSRLLIEFKFDRSWMRDTIKVIVFLVSSLRYSRFFLHSPLRMEATLAVE